MGKKLKTEHAGAKNGGGFRGKRKDAKTQSKRARRQRDKAAIHVEIKQLDAEIEQFIEKVLKRLHNDAAFGKKWRA
jgi:hypothetical protein